MIEETIDCLNENARVMYSMEWNAQHKMINKRSLADIIGELHANNPKALDPTSPSGSVSHKSDEEALAMEIRNFISEMQKLKERQGELESRLQEQEEERQEVTDQVKV